MSLGPDDDVQEYKKITKTTLTKKLPCANNFARLCNRTNSAANESPTILKVISLELL